MPQPETTPGFSTLAIHAGAAPDPSTGARVTPIYQTTSYVFNDVDHAASLFGLEAFGNIYTRIGGPTQAVLEQRIAALEGGTAALAVASGHAAQAIVFHTLLEPGDEFVAGRQLYGGSVNQFNHSFKKFDWHVRWADATNPENRNQSLLAYEAGQLVELAGSTHESCPPFGRGAALQPRCQAAFGDSFRGGDCHRSMDRHF